MRRHSFGLSKDGKATKLYVVSPDLSSFASTSKPRRFGYPYEHAHSRAALWAAQRHRGAAGRAPGTGAGGKVVGGDVALWRAFPEVSGAGGLDCLRGESAVRQRLRHSSRWR